MADPFRRSREHGVHRSCEIIAHRPPMANLTPGMQGGSFAQSTQSQPFMVRFLLPESGHRFMCGVPPFGRTARPVKGEVGDKGVIPMRPSC